MSMHLQTPLKAAFGLSTPESMTSRIERATLERAPFPHLTVPEVLPAFTLADVRSYWPDETAFSTYGDGYDRKLGDAGRFGLYVLGSAAADRCAGLDRDTREFWREFAAGPARQAMMALYRRDRGVLIFSGSREARPRDASPDAPP